MTDIHTTTTEMLKLWEEVGIEKGLPALLSYYQELLRLSRSIAFLVLLVLLLLF